MRGYAIRTPTSCGNPLLKRSARHELGAGEHSEGSARTSSPPVSLGPPRARRMARLVARLTEAGEEEVLAAPAALLRPDLGPAPLPGQLALSWNYLAFETGDGRVQARVALKEVEEVAVHDAAQWMAGRSAPALRIATARHKVR